MLSIGLAREAVAAPPANCVGKFVGTWSVTVNATGQTYRSQIRADGTLSSACFMCVAVQNWTCEGNTFILLGPGSATHTLSADGRRMSGSCCTLTRIGAPPAAAAGKATPPAASKQAGASAAAGSCPPGTRVDATANIDQRQPAGTCSSRGMSRAQCTDAGGHHFKPDSGSGFTECFFRPRADAPPPPQKSAKPHPPAPAQDNSGTSGADARPPSGSGEDVPTEAARAECSDDLPGSLYTTGPVEFYCRHDETAHLQGKEVRRRFVAIACGRGADERFARHNAAARAKERVFGMQIATARALGADAGRNEIFITDKTELVCTRSKM